MRIKRIVSLFILMMAVYILAGLFPFLKDVFFQEPVTYAESIDMKWQLTIPDPDKEKIILNNRTFHGDGETVTELHYANMQDIQLIKSLSSSWVNGEEFAAIKKEFPHLAADLIDVDKEADYFYVVKNGHDYLVFEVQDHDVTVYESYV